MLGASATEITGVGALSLLTVSTSFMLASLRRANGEIKDLRHDNRVCNWRQMVLVESFHAAKLPVPSWIWSHVPEELDKLSEEEQRSMAQRMIDPLGGNKE